MVLLKYIFAAFVIAQFGCSRTTSPNEVKIVAPNKFTTLESLGTAKNVSEQIINLDSKSENFLVLIFASDTCSKCAEEAKYWSEIFKNGVVKNIYFAHFLIGGIADDAKDWIETYHVTWDVLLDQNDSLFKKYCPAIQTPCFLIVDKTKNRTIQSYKTMRRQDLEEITGPWEF